MKCLTNTFHPDKPYTFSILALISTLILYLNDGKGVREFPLLYKILQQLKMPSETEALPTHMSTTKKRTVAPGVGQPQGLTALPLPAAKRPGEGKMKLTVGKPHVTRSRASSE